MKTSAIAHSNIALTKYWGRRDAKLMLPDNSSVSMTLDRFFSHTTVEFDPKLKSDLFVLNHKSISGGNERIEFERFMNRVRSMAHSSLFCRVESKNNFPTAAGLASSASGFAALALASSKAAGLDLSGKELSQLARFGSGSASRSVFGGFVEFNAGIKKDGSDSFARSFANEAFWPDFRMIVSIVSLERKKWNSRIGMDATRTSSPYYPAWNKTANADTKKIKRLIQKKDFSGVGKLAESNCLRMHASMMTSDPALFYWEPVTLEVIKSVIKWREEGLESYFTIDAGPQVKMLCLKKNERALVKRLNKIKGVQKTVTCKAGPAARIITEHLF